MTEPRVEVQRASDGYPLHVLVWPAAGPLHGRVMVVHGVQSHGGWYHSLGRTLAAGGYEAHFPDRRGSGANTVDRGDTPSARQLIDDIAVRLRHFRQTGPDVPTAVAGISWGGKTALVAASRHAGLVDLLALICPGLQPRVGVSRRERLAIAWAFLTDRRRRFPIPLSDPALFTANPVGQRFIAADPLSLRDATAGLLAASTFIDRMVRRAAPRINQPALLMLAGHDRIVDNAKTLAYFEHLASADKTVVEYPEGHHTLEFEPEPTRYALDLVAWLDARRGADAGGPS